HRAPFRSRRRREEARFFEASKRRYLDKFCGVRLRGEKNDYRTHCRGDACSNFAPANLIRIKDPDAHSLPPPPTGPITIAPCVTAGTGEPLVSCIMPTYNR